VVGSAGLIFPENNLEGLELLLNRFRCEPELSQRFLLAAKRQVERLYSWPAIAGQMRDVYRKAASDRVLRRQRALR
jgi:glycosyltransferase involved in cell wall biosynthesis